MNCAPAVVGDKEKRVWNLETHCLLSERIEEWMNEMKAAIATGATAKGGFILPYNNSSRTEESHCHLWKKKTVYPNPNSYLPKPPRLLLLVCATANGTNTSTNELGLGGGGGAKGSGTTARGRRLLKIREEKRKREHDRLHNYPAWAKVLEDACKDDAELRAVLGDSVGNPELMRKRVEERVRKKGRDFSKSKTGSVLAFKVTFRDFNPLDSYIWFEFYGSPSDRDVELFGSVIQSWYVMGRLGAFNSTNLQLANSSMEYDPLYDVDKGFKVMPSSFHDISDVEFQDNWGRVWVDLGTADYFAVDVLLNCLTVLSSEYLGIQQIVFGGHRIGDWEEGMTNTEDGYKYFKI